MDNCEVLLSPKALRDLDAVYAYISSVLQAPDTAEALIDKLEAEIFSLEQFPCRCPERSMEAMPTRATDNCSSRITL